MSALLFLVVAATIEVRGASSQTISTIDIQVRNTEPQAAVILETAKYNAAKMFRAAGVEVRWVASFDKTPATGLRIVVDVLQHAPSGLRFEGALATAYPFHGGRIEIFFDRLFALGAPPLPSLLAHVLVHETTHVLQGFDRHSETGIMKAVWTAADYRAMKWRPLPFTPDDVEFIHGGIARLAKKQQSTAPTTSAVEP